MIRDLEIGGVFVPGLLVSVALALVATMAAIRLLAATGLFRLIVHRPLVELAIFVILTGLLAQCLPAIGLMS